MFFSVKHPDSHSWRPDGWSLVVRTGLGYVRKRSAINDRTVRITCLDAHDLSSWFRGSARLDGIISQSGRGPHRPYKYLVAAYSLYPTKKFPFGIL